MPSGKAGTGQSLYPIYFHPAAGKPSGKLCRNLLRRKRLSVFVEISDKTIFRDNHITAHGQKSQEPEHSQYAVQGKSAVLCRRKTVISFRRVCPHTFCRLRHVFSRRRIPRRHHDTVFRPALSVRQLRSHMPPISKYAVRPTVRRHITSAVRRHTPAVPLVREKRLRALPHHHRRQIHHTERARSHGRRNKEPDRHQKPQRIAEPHTDLSL